MKYLDYCYLCINNRKASELSENPECSNCIQLTFISMPTKFKSRRITWAGRYKDSYGCNCCRFVLMNGQTYCQGYERDEDHDSN